MDRYFPTCPTFLVYSNVCVEGCQRERVHPSQGGAGQSPDFGRWCTNLRIYVNRRINIAICNRRSSCVCPGPAGPSRWPYEGPWYPLTPMPMLRAPLGFRQLRQMYLLLVCSENDFFPINNAKVWVSSVLERSVLDLCLEQGMCACVEFIFNP